MLLIPSLPLSLASDTDEGHHAVGTAPSCWSLASGVVRANCTAGGSVCGTPAQFPAWIDTSLPQHGTKFVFGYDGTHVSSSDAIKRWPGAMLRYVSSNSYVAAMPARDTNDGKDYVYVSSWSGGVEQSFRVLGARTLPVTGHYEFVANGNQYTLKVGGMAFASFQAGPTSGGWSGPGFMVGCLAKSVSLVWGEYGWRSVGAADECWTSLAGIITFQCQAPGVCGSPEQHAGFVDHTRSVGEEFTLRYRGTAAQSTDAIARYPGAILRWNGPGDFVTAVPARERSTGLSYLYVNEWSGGSETAFRQLGIGLLPTQGNYEFRAEGSSYQLWVNGLPFALFDVGPSSGGSVGVGTLLGCSPQSMAQAWSSIVLERRS